MAKRATVGIVLAGVALVAGAVLQARGALPPASAAAATPAATVAPAHGIAAEGRVVAYPGAEVKVGAERAGRLVSVLVSEGQAVRRC